MAPYERYKLVKPFIQAEEEKAENEKETTAEKKHDDKSNEDRIAAVSI